MTDHTEREREAVDGARDAFEERVRWFYANAPECQEARRHSFSRQRDMAFVLARNEDRAAVRAAVLAEVREKVDRMATRHEKQDCTLCTLDLVCHSAWLAASHNAALHAILTALEATDGR